MKRPMKKANSKPEELIEIMRKAKRVLVTGHMRPDGDSIGCMIAMARLLETQLGVKAFAVGAHEGLGGPGFLEGVERFVTPEDAARKQCDLVVCVDCAAFDRLPEELWQMAARLPVINIDHHITNTRFGRWNWVEKVSSTGEMVWRLARKAKWTLDRVSAEALWVAVITDTGRFAYDQTTPRTMRCGADLLRYDVRTAFINDKIYSSFSQTSVELKKRAFRTLKILRDGELASVSLTGHDFEETGGTKADAEDVIEIPRGIVGNRVALFFYGSEDDDTETRVSVRTREPLDATWLAKQFGGGGHERAAGFTIKEPLSKAQKTVRKLVCDWLAEGGNQIVGDDGTDTAAP